MRERCLGEVRAKLVIYIPFWRFVLARSRQPAGTVFPIDLVEKVGTLAIAGSPVL